MAKPTRPDSLPISKEASAHPGWWTVLAILIVAWPGVPVLLPIAAALPWYVYRRRHPDTAGRVAPAARWALAAWVTTVTMATLAGTRALRALPFGTDAAGAARAWVDGTGGTVPTWPALAVATALFAAAAIVSPGLLGSLVLSFLLLFSAVHAAVVFANSTNVLSACLVALPVWSALLLAGMVVLLEPLGRWGAAWRRRRTEAAPANARRRLVAGAALVAGAFAARLVLAGPLGDLVRRVTLP